MVIASFKNDYGEISWLFSAPILQLFWTFFIFTINGELRLMYFAKRNPMGWFKNLSTFNVKVSLSQDQISDKSWIIFVTSFKSQSWSKTWLDIWCCFFPPDYYRISRWHQISSHRKWLISDSVASHTTRCKRKVFFLFVFCNVFSCHDHGLLWARLLEGLWLPTGGSWGENCYF